MGNLLDEWPRTPAELRRRDALLRGCKAATRPDAVPASSLEEWLAEWDQYQASLPYSTETPPDDPFGERDPEDEENGILQRAEESDEYRRLTE